MWVTVLENGKHPKHKILKYQDWFRNKITSDSVVIDIGCNTGYMVNFLSSKCEFAYGMELNSKLYKKAIGSFDKTNIKFINADATTYDYSDLKKIDYVCLSNVLEHIELRVTFLQKLKENVNWNEEIKFLIRVPTIERDWLSVHKKNVGVNYLLDRTHYIEHTLEEFHSELLQAGLYASSLEVKFGEFFAVVEEK